MKTKMKIISLAVFAMLFFGFNAKAQQSDVNSDSENNIHAESEPVPTAISFNQISLLLSDLKIDKNEYPSGETIK